MAANGADPGPGVQFGPDDDRYEFGKEIGQGTAARVFTCKRLRTGEGFAVKAFDLRRLRLSGDIEIELAKVKREVAILEGLRHDNIVNLHCSHETENWFFLVMEHVAGGELFYEIAQRKHLKEAEAKHVFRQLLSALGYMHSIGVIHRDLKPENILIVRNELMPSDAECKLYTVKIADFGLSKVIEGQAASRAKTFLGTPQYWAPEVQDVERNGGTYDQAADFWSLGVVLFVMLAGRYPFDGKKAPLAQQIAQGSFEMAGVKWAKHSETAKDIVRGLIRVETSRRFTFDQCMEHPWLAEPLGAAQPISPAAPAAKVEGATESRIVAHSSNSASQIVPVQEVNTLFDMKWLLQSQVALVLALQTAFISMRHQDMDFAMDVKRALLKAHDLAEQSAEVVVKFEDTANQVSGTVLPDLRLAVQEAAPALATDLMGMVKDWVAQMRGGGELLQSRYAELCESIHALEPRAQHLKRLADRRLFETVSTLDPEALAGSPSSPRPLALQDAEAPDYRRAVSVRSAEERQSRASAASNPSSPDLVEAATGSSKLSSGKRSGGSEPPPAADVLEAMAQQSREQVAGLDALGATGAKSPGAPNEEDAIGRDYQSLWAALMMVPAVALTSLPTAARARPAIANGHEIVQVELGETEEAQPLPESAVAALGPAAAARMAQHSAASIAQALRQLRQVDEVLRGCALFWTCIDRTVKKLEQLKQHTEVLIKHVSTPGPLRDRFEQRLGDYEQFWKSLASQCREYHAEHGAKMPQIRQKLREVENLQDELDTRDSGRIGMEVARSNKRNRT